MSDYETGLGMLPVAGETAKKRPGLSPFRIGDNVKCLLTDGRSSKGKIKDAAIHTLADDDELHWFYLVGEFWYADISLVGVK